MLGLEQSGAFEAVGSMLPAEVVPVTESDAVIEAVAETEACTDLTEDGAPTVTVARVPLMEV